MLTPGVLKLLVFQHGKRAANTFAGTVRHDHIINKAPTARHKWISELLTVLFRTGIDLLLVPYPGGR